MVIALFGRSVSSDNLIYVQRVIDKLEHRKCRIMVFRPFYDLLASHVKFPLDIDLFNDFNEVHGKADVCFSKQYLLNLDADPVFAIEFQAADCVVPFLSYKNSSCFKNCWSL